MTAETAARLARRLRAPLVFVSVRPRLPAALRDPGAQRQWTQDMLRSRKSLDAALAAASRHGVMSHGEILEGGGATEIAELARARNARVLVVGAWRDQLVPSIFRRVINTSEQPVVVAPQSPDKPEGAGTDQERPGHQARRAS